MLGPGKYDDLCTLVREKTKANGVVVIVIDGDKGSGFSCQATVPVALALPAMLQMVVDEMRSKPKGDG